MRGKFLFVAGAAVGYVLGTRAGRKRYEQIRGAAQKVWQTPAIQHQVEAVQDYAAEKIGQIPGLVIDGAKKLVTSGNARTAPAAQPAGGEGTPTTPPAPPHSSDGTPAGE